MEMPGNKKKIGVVLTADMVNSTSFPPEETEQRLSSLLRRLQAEAEWQLKPEIYRGDSFQGVLRSPEQALYVSLLARAFLKAEAPDLDLRVAIGIGTMERLTDRSGTSDGEAFRLSGQLADNMKKNRARIAIALPGPVEPLQSVLTLLEAIVEKWTVPQAEVVLGLLTGLNRNEIAELLKISQPAVSQHASAAKWWAVEPIIHDFSKIIHAFYPYD